MLAWIIPFVLPFLLLVSLFIDFYLGAVDAQGFGLAVLLWVAT